METSVTQFKLHFSTHFKDLHLLIEASNSATQGGQKLSLSISHQSLLKLNLRWPQTPVVAEKTDQQLAQH